MPETIVAAAIRCVQGSVHSLPRPARHNNIIHCMTCEEGCTALNGTQGFLTSDGRFVDRAEAAAIAVAAGQVDSAKLLVPGMLFSEELW